MMDALKLFMLRLRFFLTGKVPVKVKKLHPDASLPKYAKDGDAGFDLAAIHDVCVQPGETVIIKTGLAMAIPKGFELQVRPRSGLSANTKLRVANSPGTIDSGYRGEIGIIMENIGDGFIRISTGDRIAQGVISIVPVANFAETNELDETERGTGGYGSTGMAS